MKIFSPYYFDKYSKWLTLLSCSLCIILLPISLYYALYASPADYQQQEMVRIMYVHVPLAWFSLGLYAMIAILSLINIVWRIPLCYVLMLASIPVGATFALLTLITGSIWGKPIWGTYWAWDARLTSMLILFLFYLSQVIIMRSGESFRRVEKPLCILSIIGAINIPIVKFSVDIWSSLHQPASILRKGGVSIHQDMLLPLILVALTLMLYAVLVILLRTRTLRLLNRNIKIN